MNSKYIKILKFFIVLGIITVILFEALYLIPSEPEIYIRQKCSDLEQFEEFVKCEIEKYDWDSNIAYAVIMAESRANPLAYNPERHNGCNGSVGLFQVACVHDDVERLKNPQYNIMVAFSIYKDSGWRPWGAYTNKSYMKYL